MFKLKGFLLEMVDNQRKENDLIYRNMITYKNILPYMLFEIASPVKPEYYDVREDNGVIFVDFLSDNIMYTMSVYKIKHEIVDDIIFYVTFSTKEIHDYIYNNYKSKSFDELNKYYSKLTNDKHPFSVLSKILWLITMLKKVENIKYIGFTSMDSKKMNIFKYYMKDFGLFIGEITHNIAPGNKEIMVYDLY